MKKLLKFLLWTVVGIVALVLVLILALPLWISPVVTGVANSMVPDYTGTKFNLESFKLNPYTGTLRVKGVMLANPEGFGTAPAVSVDAISVDVAVGELFSKKLHILNAQIEGTFVSYYSHDGTNNFDYIMQHAMAKLEENKKPEEEAAPEKEAEEEKAKGEGFRVIIDRLDISGTKVKLTENDIMPAIPIPLPTIKDIGKEKDGATFSEAMDAIWKSVMEGGNKLFGGAAGLATGALDAVSGLLGGETAESVKNTVSGAAGSATESATKAVGDAAKSAGDAVGGAVDAVKDAAGAAGDGAKKLLKGLGL